MGGGLALLFGLFTRPVGLVLAIWCVATALIAHPNLADRNQEEAVDAADGGTRSSRSGVGGDRNRHCRRGVELDVLHNAGLLEQQAMRDQRLRSGLHLGDVICVGAGGVSIALLQRRAGSR